MKRWIMIGSVVLTALVILGAALYLSTRKTDRGFIADFPCAELRWDPDRMPLPIYLDESADGWASTIWGGVLFWEDATGGLPLFTEPIPVTEGISETRDGIIYIMQVPGDGHPTSSLIPDESCHIRRVVIRLPAETPTERMDQVLRHELGHAIGLEHDDLDESIMHWGGPAIRWGLNEVTPHDAKRLREAYQ